MRNIFDFIKQAPNCKLSVVSFFSHLQMSLSTVLCIIHASLESATIRTRIFWKDESGIGDRESGKFWKAESGSLQILL
jgi:hypothetical protein